MRPEISQNLTKKLTGKGLGFRAEALLYALRKTAGNGGRERGQGMVVMA